MQTQTLQKSMLFAKQRTMILMNMLIQEQLKVRQACCCSCSGPSGGLGLQGQSNKRLPGSRGRPLQQLLRMTYRDVLQRVMCCMACSVTTWLTFLNQSTFEAVAMMLQKTALGQAGLTSGLSTDFDSTPLAKKMAQSAVCRDKFRRQFVAVGSCWPRGWMRQAHSCRQRNQTGQHIIGTTRTSHVGARHMFM